jgi:hypothetical protein
MSIFTPTEARSPRLASGTIRYDSGRFLVRRAILTALMHAVRQRVTRLA